MAFCYIGPYYCDMINRALIRMVHMSASDITKQAAIEAGTSLFYHMAQLITEDLKNYPPTRQFFAACIEILGQVWCNFNISL